MKKIKILHPNIQGQPAFTEFNLNESDLMFAKAKKMIFGIIFLENRKNKNFTI